MRTKKGLFTQACECECECKIEKRLLENIALNNTEDSNDESDPLNGMNL